jgi:hypothetical protein
VPNFAQRWLERQVRDFLEELRLDRSRGEQAVKQAAASNEDGPRCFISQEVGQKAKNFKVECAQSI